MSSSSELNQVDLKDKAFTRSLLYNVKEGDVKKELRFLIDGWKHSFRIKVFLREGVDKNSTFKMLVNLYITTHNLEVIVNEIRDLKDKKPDYEFELDLFSPVWEDDKRTNDKVLTGSILVGKKIVNEKVVYYVGVKDANNKKYLFKLGCTPYCKLKINGKEVSPEEEGERYSKAYAESLNSIIIYMAELLPDKKINK